MGEEKKDERKSYTFTDKRGLDKEEREDLTVEKKESSQAEQGPSPMDSVPKIDFATLIMSFASASMISMGRLPDPMTGKIQKNLVISQQNIDIINLLKEKTRGNLTQEEEGLLDQILYELRMNYIEASKDQ